MIQANELRIGNRFNRELRNAKCMDFDPDFILTEEWMGKLFGNDLSIALEDLHPIPLTPEILKSYGFQKYQWQDSWYIKTIYGSLFIHFFKEQIITKLAKVSKDSYGQKMHSLGFFGKEKTVDHYIHLHQVQNLYFILTGKELKKHL